MIELRNDNLIFRFPEVHPSAVLNIDLQRTLRIPDDDKTHFLPPGLGSFPLRHVDDYGERIPRSWHAHGGVLMPMYQSEAMWIYFAPRHDAERRVPYPFAIRVATGKIDAVTGETWTAGLHRDPQNYMVAPHQPWLDGYCVEKGVIRQFVAMPLGAGYSAEEQITGKADHGGLQIQVYPMKREAFERRFPVAPVYELHEMDEASLVCCLGSDMGLAPGGKMKQEIYADPYDPADWNTDVTGRCFVHIANSLVWRAITGELPPTTPPTAREYSRSGLPWFDYYSDDVAVDGSNVLQQLRSVLDMGKEKGDVPLPENEPVSPDSVVVLRRGLGKEQVREGSF